jgi:molecular chaperone DnaJ
MKIPAGTPSGRVLRVRGRGVEGKSRTGDLLVTIEISVPKDLPQQAKDAVTAYQEATAGIDPRAGLEDRARKA